MTQLHEGLIALNEETMDMLEGQGHRSIRERMKKFKIKYIKNKIDEIVKW